MSKTKLRQYARGKPCMVRIPMVCNHDPATTVLAHLGGAGMGLKGHDLIAAWCCSDCHAAVDYRNFDADIGTLELRRYHLDGIVRTQQELLKTANRHGFTLAEAIEEWARGLEV